MFSWEAFLQFFSVPPTKLRCALYFSFRLMVTGGKIALEFVQRAAIWAACFPQFPYRNEYPRMRIPQGGIRHWAVERQGFGRNLNVSLFGMFGLHISFPKIKNNNLAADKEFYT